jgi:hypothetical protein
MFDVHPDCVILPFDVNTKYKQPFGAEDVIDCGSVVPEYEPINGAAALFPLYIVKTSLPISVSNDVKVIVTLSPGVEGQISVARLELLA